MSTSACWRTADGVLRALGILVLAAMVSSCGSHSAGSASNTPPTSTSPPPSAPPPPPAAPFTATLDATSVIVPQGSIVGVWVTLNRASGFADDVTVALDSAPAGLNQNPLTIPGAANESLFQLETTSTAATGGPVDLTLLVSGGGTTVRLTLAMTVTAAVPTSESLIAVDLAAGKIDYATSLLYRAYALFNDSRLPTQYAGSANPRNDGFFHEASNPNLPADLQAQLQPFLARPDDPASIFQQPTNGRSKASAAIRAGDTGTASACTLGDGQIEHNGWKSELFDLAGGGSLRLWVECSGSQEFDDTSLQLMQKTAAAYADNEVALMGPPVPDKGGDFFGTDTAIDVYLVSGCEKVPRTDADSLCNKAEKSPTVSGAAVDTYDNGAAQVCSAYVLLSRNEIGRGAFSSTFVHEIFHVLQDALACSVGEQDTEFWFREASATWAEAHFVPDTAVQEVHSRFGIFVKSSESLHSSSSTNPDRIYADYIWPYFFDTKKGGGAASVASAWHALTGATSLDAANQTLDTSVYKFKTNFRDFAVTNLNKALPDDLKESDLYQAAPGSFPKDMPQIPTTTFSDAENVTEALDMNALSASYSRYSVSGTKLQKVTFKFGDIVQRAGLDIDALVQINGQPWKRNKYDDVDQVKFCLDKPDQKLTDSYWVLSNHNVPMDQHVQGNFKVEASDVGCGKQWSGTTTAQVGYTMTASVTWTYDDQHSTDTVAYFQPTGSVSFAFPGCSVSPNTHSIAPAEGTLKIDYSTTPATYIVEASTVWLATYNCGGSPYQAGAGGFWLEDFNNNPPGAMGTVPPADKNGNTVLSGSVSNNSTSFTWNFTGD